MNLTWRQIKLTLYLKKHSQTSIKLQSMILGTIDYRKFEGPSEHIPARQRIRQIIERTNLSTHSFSDSLKYKVN